jgi:acyl carrier protein
MVLPQDLEEFIDQWISVTPLNLLEEILAKRGSERVYSRPNLRTPYVSPRNETEAKIAQVWAECLAIDKVGIHDHFFELGGNSLLGMLILSRLEKELGTRISAAAIYEGPTVGELYEAIRPDRGEESVLTRERSRGGRRKELRRRQRTRRGVE